MKKEEVTLTQFCKELLELADLPKTKKQKIREKILDNRRPKNKRYHQENSVALKQKRIEEKRKCFDHYGGKCVCCGETTFEFLSIDHVDGDGAKQRRETGMRGGLAMYRFLRKHGYPPGYRTLCFNCNLSRGFHDYCPHEIKPTTMT